MRHKQQTWIQSAIPTAGDAGKSEGKPPDNAKLQVPVLGATADAMSFGNGHSIENRYALENPQANRTMWWCLAHEKCASLYSQSPRMKKPRGLLANASHMECFVPSTMCGVLGS
mmetsp:Transcript_6548/g.21180  ORF Transcript_6548/g.21180 Transcript_6548/m.21180 type:complete len:114 (-) Transcript_6548:842-1183(-)